MNKKLITALIFLFLLLGVIFFPVSFVNAINIHKSNNSIKLNNNIQNSYLNTLFKKSQEIIDLCDFTNKISITENELINLYYSNGYHLDHIEYIYAYRYNLNLYVSNKIYYFNHIY